MTDSALAERIIKSHTWVVEDCSPYGTESLMCRMRCSACGLGKVMILYDIDEGIKNRQKMLRFKER